MSIAERARLRSRRNVSALPSLIQNIQQVAVQNRTVPGLKQATPGAIYPGVSVFMYPREMPAGRPGA